MVIHTARSYLYTCNEQGQDHCGCQLWISSLDHEIVRDKAVLVFRDPAMRYNDTE